MARRARRKALLPLAPRAVTAPSVPVKVRDVIKRLKSAAGHTFAPKETTASFASADGRITVVSGKLGDDVRPGTFQAILRQTKMEGRDE